MRIGIYGYGNLGKGVALSVRQNADLELAAIFTRRPPEQLKQQNPELPFVSASEINNWKDRIDVLVICGGSATDLPGMTPALAEHFHVIDSFDTHANIPAHFDAVDTAARAGGRLGLISAGWDPGVFSLMRTYAGAFLPDGCVNTFWGRGVSQGHSDAVRRIDGVLDARQYTLPVPAALEAVRSGDAPELTTRQRHTRECFVVAAEGADRARIEHEIVTMPNYFDEYDTTVHFITAEEMARDHAALPHGGFVIRTGRTGAQHEHRHVMELRLQLDSNPEFTASVLTACARAVWRMAAQGRTGCITMLDIPPALLSPLPAEELRAHLL